MTKTLFYVSVALLCLSSCATNNYEKAIADWIQTDKNGTWTDLKFDIIEVIETKDITVSDSVQVLKEKFEKSKEKKIKTHSVGLKGAERRLSFVQYAISKADKLKPYQDEVDKAKAQLDSIQSLSFTCSYDGREPTEVIAKLIKCKYAIVPPVLNTRQEKTETFLLNPKMDKCLAKIKQKQD